MGQSDIGERLRKARKAKGFTQEELAKCAGATQDQIQKIENGAILRPRNIETLAKCLEISPAWLQFGLKDLEKLDQDSINLALKLADLNPEKLKVILATLDALGT